MLRVLVLVGLLGFSSVSHAQQRHADPVQFEKWNADRPYEGACVVRVRTTSQAQLDSALEIAADVWSERIGIGVLELQLDRDQLGRLKAIGVPYDILIEDLQAHADAHAADMRAIRQREATQTPDESRRGAGVHDDSWFTTYRTLDEITQYCENLALQRPDLASISTIGQSWEGRDMFSITISGPDTVANPVNERPALFIFSTVHAREWIAPMTTCYIASKLVSDYDKDDQVRMLLDHARVVVVPVGNPDGYLYTWSVERYWRKSRRDNGDGNFGVDINRNWGYEWGGSGSSGQTGSNTYRGAAPFSEPETRALRDVALGLGQSLVAHIDYHSYSQLVLWPYGYADGVITPEPYASELQAVSGCIADTIFSTTGAHYNPIQSVDLYPAAGDSSDWFFGELARMSFTIELRTRNSFSPPPSEIRPCGRENYEAFLVVMDKAARHQRYLHQPMQHRELFDERRVRLHPFANAEVIDESSLTLMTRIGTSGTFSALPMSIESPNVFTAELPEGMCGDQVQYYFRVERGDGSITTFPEAGQADPYESIYTARAHTYTDLSETDRGWSVGDDGDTATSGRWERAIPQQTSHQPSADHTGDAGSYCWITDARAGSEADEHDVDGGITTLTSPRFSAIQDSVLSFWYWQVPSDERRDLNIAWISNDDGASWTTLSYLRSPSQALWTKQSYLIADHVEPTNTMRVRFTVQDIRDDSTVELAIDDIAVGVPGCPVNAADINADGSLNIFDVSKFIEFFTAESISADYNGDLEINFFDVAAYLQIFLGG